jgi:CDP-glucose 4,6-dehydratase
VLDAVRLAGDGVRAVVNVTTDKVYEEGPASHRETDRLGGADPYASSKACAEMVTAAYRQSFFSGDGAPRVASARAGNVIGGGDFGEDRLVPDVMRAATAGDRVVIRNPHSIRPWQHVLNPLSGYLLLAQRLFESGEFAQGWNFGPPDDDALPVGAIVDRLGELWPGGIEREFGDEGGPHEAMTLKLDSSLARDRLGWEPAWDLDRALQSIVEWHASHRDGGDVRAVVLEQIRAYQTDAAA